MLTLLLCWIFAWNVDDDDDENENPAGKTLWISCGNI